MKATAYFYRSLVLSCLFTFAVLFGNPLYAQFGDNLGKHKADRALDMNAKDLQNVALLKYKTLSVTDKATGDIGTAATTVDLYTTFEVNQATPGQTLTLHAPTAPFVGQTAYVKNTGTVSFTMYGTTVAANAIAQLAWDGTSWAVVATGQSVNALGTPSGTNANGGSISGNTLTLSLADGTNPGLVSTAAQTLAGDKTFTGNTAVGATATPGAFPIMATSTTQVTVVPTLNANTTITADGGSYHAGVAGKLTVSGTNTGSKYGTLGVLEVPSTNSTNITTPLLCGSGNWFTNYGTGNISMGFGSCNRAVNAPAAGNVTALYASYNSTNNYATAGTVSYADGTYTKASNASTGTITTAYATTGIVENSGGGLINSSYGGHFTIINSSTGTINGARGLYSCISNTGTGTMGSVYGLAINGWSNTGTITNSYGIYMDNTIDVGTTTKYAIYSGSTSTSYLAGKLGLGITAPTAALHLKAGTATADTAPLKLTAGTNLTAPEDGAVEFDGTHYYGTVGTTRYQLDQQATGAVTAIGGIDTQTKADNGAVISGNSLVLQTADGTKPGLVSTAAQTLAGDKTLNGNTVIATGKNLTVASGTTSLTAASDPLLLAGGVSTQTASAAYSELVMDNTTGAIRKAPVVIRLSDVLDNTITTPPATPVVDDAYIVPTGATGDWAGQTDKIATWNGTSWNLYTPVATNQTSVNTGTNAGNSYTYSGSAWLITPVSPTTNWSLTGNSTVGSGFVGTKDAVDLTFKTNNATRMTVTSVGKVGIGTATPTAALHLKAGTSAANTAPLKFTSSAGAILTTAEAGSMEYDGTNLYFTPSGITRKTVAYTSDLTSGYVPYTGANANVNLGANSLTTPTIATSAATASLFNTVATTLNIGNAATTVSIGANTGTTTVRNNLAVLGGTLSTSAITANLFNTSATTLNIGGAATAVSIGKNTGTTTVNGNLAVNGGDITTTETDVSNLFNANTPEINFGGDATTITMGASTGTTTINNNVAINGAGLTLGTGGGTAAASIAFHDANTGFGNFITLQSPADITNAYTLTLPADPGTNGQTLITDDLGNLSWSNAGAAPPITAVNSTNLFSTGFTGTGSGVTTTDNSVFLGVDAGNGATNASNSNFFGQQAGETATDANNSNFMGYYAGQGATSAEKSNFIGYAAGQMATGATESNFIGPGAGSDATSAFRSNFIGNGAGEKAANADHSNFIGNGAGYGASAASYSNLIGHNVGDELSSGIHMGINNIVIGTNISLGNGISNAINLGGVLFGTGTYASATGEPSIVPVAGGRIGIGITTPASTLDVNGTLTLTGVTSGSVGVLAPATVTTPYTLTLPDAQATSARQVLTNDGSGNLSWGNTESLASKTSNYTLSATDNTIVSSNAAIMTLPAASTMSGKIFRLVSGGGTSTISGSLVLSGSPLSSYALNTSDGNRGITVQSDGTDWVIIGRF